MLLWTNYSENYAGILDSSLLIIDMHFMIIWYGWAELLTKVESLSFLSPSLMYVYTLDTVEHATPLIMISGLRIHYSTAQMAPRNQSECHANFDLIN